ncbi:MAG TPA: NAD-dependent epimerase [Gammaproteobacteria bacterium]|nr:NAD-dependent epimerase [Gammaproteobacteria bacterium]
MKILVTGAAGFIGFHTAKQLLEQNVTVVGIDNLNDYYDVTLKEARLKELAAHPQAKNFTFVKLDISDAARLQELFAQHNFTQVIHLAAQAGVRYSITNPSAYVQSNLVGFANILENCRQQKIMHLVYAASSSVYGLNTTLPFSENVSVNHPVSFYGATKRANEIMAHSYSSLYNLPTTGLRFFTVYGPWGRPDMALFKFTKAILADEPIDVFNYGEHYRDFTYIDDIVTGIVKVAARPAISNPYFDATNPDPATSSAPWRVFNIGNNTPVKLTTYIELLEKYLGKKARLNLLPLQPGDVPDTYADVTNLEQAVNYRPTTTIETGVQAFLEWYLQHYQRLICAA